MPGAVRPGIGSTMIAWAGDATWIERWITFVDALRQVAKLLATRS